MINKKIKIIFFILFILSLGITITCYFLSFPNQKKNPHQASNDKVLVNPNFWNIIRKDIRSRLISNKAFSDKQENDLAKLEALGYLPGYQKKSNRKHVTIYKKEKAYNGYNLYVSGYNPSSVHSKEVFLIDMKGKVLHKWHPLLDQQQMLANWRRTYLYENGDLLIIVENLILVKLDKDSNIKWIYRGNPHHDLFVDKKGTIYLLSLRERIDPKYPEKPIYDDYICILSPLGNELKCVSIIDSILRSNFTFLLNRIKGKYGDILHTNTIEVLDGRLAHESNAFKKGNVLISMRNLNTVCIVDLNSKKVVWALSDLWKYQHQPTILENGNMLVFDNNPTLEDIKAIGNINYFLKEYKSLSDTVNEGAFSRVIEMNPFSKAIVWEYIGDKNYPLYSFVLGSAQRLPNGNTLITESVAGRVFEVRKTKEIVWEFINPHTAGKKNELIATLNEVIRIPPDFPIDWCNSKN